MLGTFSPIMSSLLHFFFYKYKIFPMQMSLVILLDPFVHCHEAGCMFCPEHLYKVCWLSLLTGDYDDDWLVMDHVMLSTGCDWPVRGHVMLQAGCDWPAKGHVMLQAGCDWLHYFRCRMSSLPLWSCELVKCPASSGGSSSAIFLARRFS